jgi:hypothetical protein
MAKRFHNIAANNTDELVSNFEELTSDDDTEFIHNSLEIQCWCV